MKTTFTLLRNKTAFWLSVGLLLTLPLREECLDKRLSTPKIDGATFGVSISPDGVHVLLFLAEDGQGDTENGTLRLMTLGDRPKVFERISSLPGEGAIVWLSNTLAYVSAAEGTFRVDAQTGETQILVKKDTAGLAVSPEKSRFAFWELNDSEYKLTVCDVGSAKLLKQWSLPSAYSGHLTGFNLAFLTEEVVVARTFDSEFKTPLKAFDISQNSIVELAQNTNSVVSLPDGGVIVTAGKNGRTLAKVSTTSTVIPIKTGFEFDVLEQTGNPRWLIGRSSLGKTALIDVYTWRVHELKHDCHLIAVGPTGKALVFERGKLKPAPEECHWK